MEFAIGIGIGVVIGLIADRRKKLKTTKNRASALTNSKNQTKSS